MLPLPLYLQPAVSSSPRVQVAILDLLAATAAAARRDREAGPRRAALAAVSTVALIGLPAVARRLRGESACCMACLSAGITVYILH